jgi:D-alanine-D-alanine ligase-like ATP-grasp enzyme
MATMLPEPAHPLVPVEPNSTGPSDADGAALDVIFPSRTAPTAKTARSRAFRAGQRAVPPRVLGSALGMDKVVQKTLWRGLGLPVVDF